MGWWRNSRPHLPAGRAPKPGLRALSPPCPIGGPQAAPLPRDPTQSAPRLFCAPAPHPQDPHDPTHIFCPHALLCPIPLFPCPHPTSVPTPIPTTPYSLPHAPHHPTAPPSPPNPTPHAGCAAGLREGAVPSHVGQPRHPRHPQQRRRFHPAAIKAVLLGLSTAGSRNRGRGRRRGGGTKPGAGGRGPRCRGTSRGWRPTRSATNRPCRCGRR